METTWIKDILVIEQTNYYTTFELIGTTLIVKYYLFQLAVSLVLIYVLNKIVNESNPLKLIEKRMTNLYISKYFEWKEAG